MGTENILWKCEIEQIIFLDFTGTGSLKYTERKKKRIFTLVVICIKDALIV